MVALLVRIEEPFVRNGAAGEIGEFGRLLGRGAPGAESAGEEQSEGRERSVHRDVPPETEKTFRMIRGETARGLWELI
jgi:hypothetical protein